MAEGGISRREVLKGGAAALALLSAYRTAGAKSLGRAFPVADHALEPAAGSTVDLNMLVANTTLAWWQDVVKMFNKTSPYTIKPNFSIISNGNAKTQLPAALSSGSAPDISYTLEDFQAAGALVSAGLLSDWSPYAKKYGWQQKYGPNEWQSFYLHSPTLAAVSYDAVPHPFVWYFPSTFKKLGLTVPANRIVSLAQYKSYVQAGQKAGMQGLVIGNHDIWPGSQTLSITCQRTMSAQSLAKLQAAWYKNNGSKWTDPKPMLAITRLQQMVKDNLFAPAVNALSYNDAQSVFLEKKALLHQDGYWFQQVFNTLAKGEDIDFFQFPVFDPSIPVRIINFGANGMCLPKKGKNPAAAAAVFNTALSVPAQQLFMSKFGNYPGILGLAGTAGATYPDAALKNVVALVSKTESNTFQMENDAPAPIAQKMMELTASLLALQVTPAQFASQLQAMIEQNIG